jgi:SAM-dependent methyltransferase
VWVTPSTLKILETILRYGLAVLAAIYMGRQVRKPTKWTGRFMVWLMNLTHSKLTDWGLQRVQIQKDFAILDVGCGGGRTIQKLAAAAPQGTVYGIDYADGSVSGSRAKNAELVRAGRVAIEQASVSQLPFADSKFDLVTAVETQYYWPEPLKDMQEIRRVLKPGGTLLIIAESYKTGAYEKLQRPIMKALGSTNLSPDDQRALFSAAGYVDVQIFEERSKGWICVTGRKAP